MTKRLSLFTLLICLLGHGVSNGQTLGPDYATCGLSIANLGSVGGVPLNYGGIDFKSGDPDVLLMTGNSNQASGAIYEVPVTRNASGQITSLGTAVFYASADDPDGSSVDGGLDYLPGNVLAYVTYPNNWLGQILPGSTSADKMIDLESTPGWNAGSTGALQLVPEGLPGEGRLKIGSYAGDRWHDATLSPDGSGTFDITIHSDLDLGHDIVGFVYVPGVCPPCFVNDAVLIGSYDEGQVFSYDVDANGDPILATQKVFIDNIDSQVGATIDPVTGDLFFVDWGASNEVVVVRNTSCPVDIDADNDGISNSDEGCDGNVCVDTDSDGIEDYLDLDSDNDGILDILEAGLSLFDTNNDGLIDASDAGFTDANMNGMDDAVELLTPLNTDGDSYFNFQDADSDQDGCPDVSEAGFTDDNDDGQLGPDPVVVDSAGLVTSGSDGYTAPNSIYLDGTMGYCIVEVCDDGIDNDADGLTDCADDDCLLDSNCNLPPVALDDTASGAEDEMLVIDVLANDSDPNGALGIPGIQGAPSYGSTSVNGDGTITYTPDPGFFGSDSFTYEICDVFDASLCDQATVSISISEICPDLEFNDIVVDYTVCPSLDIALTISNLGNEDMAAGVPVSVYDGNPELPGASIITTVNTSGAIPVGSSEVVHANIVLFLRHGGLFRHKRSRQSESTLYHCFGFSSHGAHGVQLPQ